MFGLPRGLGAQLVGRGLDELRPRRRFQSRIVWQSDEGATHPSQGQFIAQDADDPHPVSAVAITPVSAAAQQLADEARQLSEGLAPSAEAPQPAAHRAR